jgi:hypothetical protein
MWSYHEHSQHESPKPFAELPVAANLLSQRKRRCDIVECSEERISSAGTDTVCDGHVLYILGHIPLAERSCVRDSKRVYSGLDPSV